MDVNLSVLESALDEYLHGTLSDLPRTVDIKGSERYGGHGEFLIIRLGKMLGGKLADGIGPSRLSHRSDVRFMILFCAKCRFSENLARRKIDKALQPAELRCAFEDIGCSDHGRQSQL